MLILFAERFAYWEKLNQLENRPPHADSFCRKVCFAIICHAKPFSPASCWFFLQKGLHTFACHNLTHSGPPHADSFCRKVCRKQINLVGNQINRLMLILFAERFAKSQSRQSRHYRPASCWFFLQKGLLCFQALFSIADPPHADSFCRKVCYSGVFWTQNRVTASCWFFLQKGLLFNFDNFFLNRLRLMLILFAERFAKVSIKKGVALWYRLMLILFAERFAPLWFL